MDRFGLNGANVFHSMMTPSTDVDDPGDLNRFNRTLLTFAAVVTVIIMIVGIFGNLLTVIALLKCPKVRNVAAAFIISLCVADCLFCMVVLPFNVFRFIHGTWTHGDVLCRLIPFLQYGNVGVSLLCIAMITINRYIMITHNTSYAQIYKRHWIAAMLAFCWVFAYGMQMPTLFGVWGAFGYDENLGTCSILKDSNGRSSKTALFIAAFVIPCLIIIWCYTRIFWVVHKSELRMRKHASKQNAIPNNLRAPSKHIGIKDTNKHRSNAVQPIQSTSQIATITSGAITSNDIITAPTPDNDSVPSQCDSGITSTGGGELNASPIRKFSLAKTTRIKDTRDVKAKRNEWRITKMVLAIFLSFVMCYLPITIVKIADKDVAHPTFHIIGYLLLYLSACINPIIYVIMNKQYRQAYKTVILCKPGRFMSFTHGGSTVGEKWKDVGYSYNHSRTMVSQVSLPEEPSSYQPTQQRKDSPHPKRSFDIHGSTSP